MSKVLMAYYPKGDHTQIERNSLDFYRGKGYEVRELDPEDRTSVSGRVVMKANPRLWDDNELAQAIKRCAEKVLAPLVSKLSPRQIHMLMSFIRGEMLPTPASYGKSTAMQVYEAFMEQHGLEVLHERN